MIQAMKLTKTALNGQSFINNDKTFSFQEKVRAILKTSAKLYFKIFWYAF